MKVTLINPPFLFSSKSEIIHFQCLGILYLASYLNEKNHEVQIIDALEKGKNNIIKYEKGILKVGLSNKEIIDNIEPGTELIGISVPFSHFAKIAHELINDIKKVYNNIPVVIGGVYSSTQPELAVKSGADYIVMGEGEVPLLNIINYLSGKDTSLNNSIITKKSDLSKAKSYFLENLDELPLPARDIINFDSYSYKSPRQYLPKGWRSASIITSKGCPYDCEFCSVHPISGYKWRPFSVKRVLLEIDELINKYKINHFDIEDDNFTLNSDRAEEILDGFIERKSKHHLSWSAPNGLRIDTLNETLIKKFKESNCWAINIAIEHGDEEVLKLINKKLDLKKITEVFKLLKKYEIAAGAFIICGYPEETAQRFQNAFEFYKTLKKINPNTSFSSCIVQPYPNSKLFKRCVKEGYLPENLFSDISDIKLFSTSSKIWIAHPDFNKKEIIRRKKLLQKTLSNRKSLKQKILDKVPPPVFALYRFIRSCYKKI